jgi:hypothetical protein
MCRGDEVALVAVVIGDEDGSSGSKDAARPEVCENRSPVGDRECELFIREMMPPSVLPSKKVVHEDLLQPDESLAREPISAIELVAPEPTTAAALRRVHDPGYVDAVCNGNPRELAESQGFHWDSALWEMVCCLS